MKTLTHNLKLANIIPAKAYSATENLRAIDLAGLVQATGTLSIATNPTDGDTVVIGSRTYTFQASLTNVDGHVLIGADAAASQANLVHAINLNGGTSGTDYAAAMTKHAYVTISDFTTNVATVTAKTAGTDANSLATTDTLTAAADGFAATTLTGGKDGPMAESAIIPVSIGNVTGSPTSVKVKIQESDTVAFSSSATALGGEEVTISRNTNFHFHVTPSKRYLRAVITFSGGSSPTAVVAGTAILSDIASPLVIDLESVN